MEAEVDRLISKAEAAIDQDDCAYKNRLIKFYRDSDLKDAFVNNLIAELVESKKILN
jgi:hypothetical protein